MTAGYLIDFDHAKKAIRRTGDLHRTSLNKIRNDLSRYLDGFKSAVRYFGDVVGFEFPDDILNDTELLTALVNRFAGSTQGFDFLQYFVKKHSDQIPVGGEIDTTALRNEVRTIQECSAAA